MTNNFHHPRAGINTVFLSLGLGYHQIQFVGLEFLQCGGHQISVNTGSYATLVTYVAALGAQQFQFPCRVVLTILLKLVQTLVFSTLKTFTKVATLAAYGGFSSRICLTWTKWPNYKESPYKNLKKPQFFFGKKK